MEFKQHVKEKLEVIESKMDRILVKSVKNEEGIFGLNKIIYKIIFPALGLLLGGIVTLATRIF